MLPLKLIGRRVPAGTPSEIIFFVIAAVIMALGLLPFGTEVRFILPSDGRWCSRPWSYPNTRTDGYHLLGENGDAFGLLGDGCSESLATS